MRTYSERNRLASFVCRGADRLRCDLLSSTDAAGQEIERKRAKVGVEGSSPFARSKFARDTSARLCSTGHTRHSLPLISRIIGFGKRMPRRRKTNSIFLFDAKEWRKQ